ncbi:MAG: glycoside hydrolase family 11 protein [Clostridium sp.]|nr:glycoside hydrolase family 11 protein [Clostridium sp.]
MKMKPKKTKFVLTVLTCLALILPAAHVEAAAITSNQTGTHDGYDYELWKDSGTTSMTLGSGGTFSCSWSDIGNALFRKGKKFDQTKTHQQLGNISISYGCNYQPNGNSYLCVYGWTTSPLVEFYIVDSWGSWRPPGATSKGTITVDGGTYDIYETTRVNQPSIQGNTTFQQYWSVRTATRTSGTISVSQHFNAWENLGMTLGNMYEVALTVEGYQSSGTADVYSHTLTIGGSGTGGGGTGGGGNTGSGTTVECESMATGGQYAQTISSPFSGVALYANNDYCSYSQYFANGTHNFSLKGASSGSSTASVDLVIGGVTKGTFTFSGTSPSVSTLNNISHGTGNQEVKLVVTNDTGQWDVYLDQLVIN